MIDVKNDPYKIEDPLYRRMNYQNGGEKDIKDIVDVRLT